MDITTSTVDLMVIQNAKALDPISVICRDYGKGQGSIIITCYGEAWTAYWGGMGDNNVKEFFVSCNQHYLMGYLDPQLDSWQYDIDQLRKDTEAKGVEWTGRDDPWNDYDFLAAMYGPDPYNWSDELPKTSNHQYEYVCRIIRAVQDAFKQEAESG